MRGATAPEYTINSAPKKFQSTRPMRGATSTDHGGHEPRHISIHAPHAGRDYYDKLFDVECPEFQSTRPMRGATLVPLSNCLLA